MGRGSGGQEVALSLSRSDRQTARRDALRAQLQADYGQLGLQTMDQIDQADRDIVDPDLSQANLFVDGKNPDPVRPYTSLFRYHPALDHSRQTWASVEIKLDHKTGELCVVSEATKGGGMVGYVRPIAAKVVRCGRDISQAVDQAEALKEEVFEAFFASEAGKKARYGKSPWGPFVGGSHTQQAEHSDAPFHEQREAVAERLPQAVENMTRYSEHLSSTAEAEAQREQRAAELGYLPAT